MGNPESIGSMALLHAQLFLANQVHTWAIFIDSDVDKNFLDALQMESLDIPKQASALE